MTAKVKVRFLTSAVGAFGFEYRRGEVYEVTAKFAEEMVSSGAAEPVAPETETATRSVRRRAVANAGGDQR
jgi:hypothetical protein